jgi:hypothetical protein
MWEVCGPATFSRSGLASSKPLAQIKAIRVLQTIGGWSEQDQEVLTSEETILVLAWPELASG